MIIIVLTHTKTTNSSAFKTKNQILLFFIFTFVFLLYHFFNNIANTYIESIIMLDTNDKKQYTINIVSFFQGVLKYGT